MFHFVKSLVFIIFSLIFCSSCSTTRVVSNTRTPEVRIEASGIIRVGDRQVNPGKIGKALKSAGFSKDQEIKVLISDKNDRALMQAVSSDLVMSGFMRPIFITNKITESTTKKKK